MPEVAAEIEAPDFHCGCGCANCKRQKDALFRAWQASLNQKRTTQSERLPEGSGRSGGDGPEKEGRRRGQQPGSPGHGRRSYDHLPMGEEVVLEPEAKDLLCGTCGLPYEVAMESSSDELDLEVVVRRKRTRRPAHRQSCRCGGSRALVQVAAPPRLVPRGLLTVSTVSWLLLLKFEMAMPVERICRLLTMTGVDLSPGTVAGVLERMMPLLEALAAPIREHTRLSPHLHTDETGWRLLGMVREEWGRKCGWLWVLVGADSVSYLLAEDRSTASLARHLGLDPERPELAEGRSLVLSCDRYSGNVSLLLRCPQIVGMFCWAHVRRDFWKLREVRGLERWAKRWLERIAQLYRVHRSWNQCPQPDGSDAERSLHEQVQAAIGKIEKAMTCELKADRLHPRALKVLDSLYRHWPGLQPATRMRGRPLDNNPAERALRNQVIVERNCLGSASEWSARLAAATWTVIGTAKMAGFNPHLYMTDYLDGCRLAGGKAPDSLDRFLPWSASDADSRRWRGLVPDSS